MPIPHISSRGSGLLAILVVCAAACSAQVPEPSGTLPGAHPPRQVHHSKLDSKSAAATPPHSPTVIAQPADASTPPSLLDQPAQAATVALVDGTLSVKARNSSLAGILDVIARKSGMSISGLGSGGLDPAQRVFGIYGPGDPRDVLSELLEGAGYNVLMVGSTKTGAPRELALSARSNAPIASQIAQRPQTREDAAEPDTPSQAPPDQNEPLRTPAQVYGRMMVMRQMQAQQEQPQ